MRIIFVRQSYSSFGGGELILDNLIRKLVEQGVEVAIIARSWPEGRTEPEFIRCDPPRIARALRDRLFAASACGVIGKQSGSLIQAHEKIPCCDIYRAGDGVHAAYLERRRQSSSKFENLAMQTSLFHRSVLGLEKNLFASSRLKAVLVNSLMVRDEIIHHYDYPRERIHLVPNGIDLTRFSPMARQLYREDTRRRFGVPEKRPVALFIGSGYARKGLAAAIKALARSTVDAELWVVGHERRPADYVALAESLGIGKRLRVLGPQVDPLPFYPGFPIWLH